MVSDLIAHELAQPYPTLVRLIGVKVRNHGEVKKLNGASVIASLGDPLVLEHDGELTYGIVHTEPYTVPFSPPMRVMKSVLRVPTTEESAIIRRQPSLSQEGMAFCREQAAALGLRMKMVEVYAALDRRHITFVYTADDRIDFRELVRILARRFHSRIEMRQIGAREEAKRLGGVDTCGLVLCCASFLTDFQPVSAKQARKLGVPVDDPKLLGVCGRLKCCLMFEAMEANSPTCQSSRLISPSSSSPVSS
ncbi:MAG: stage 0 sporulation family protein [Nitrospiraceae bacterium]